MFVSQNPKTKWYGLDCITYIISQILNSFEVWDSISLKTFKHNKIKILYCNSCICYCCKPRNHHLQFIKMFSDGFIYTSTLEYFNLMLHQLQCGKILILSDIQIDRYQNYLLFLSSTLNKEIQYNTGTLTQIRKFVDIFAYT